MSVQPIDLQNLFLRLDQIGKDQAARQEAALQQQAVTGLELEDKSIKSKEHVKDVNETEESHTVADEPQQHSTPQENTTSDEDADTVQDPEIGQNIDISS